MPNGQIRFNRAWAMPSPDTFSIPPIRSFVKRHLMNSRVSIDPFSRNCRFIGGCKLVHTNDLNPDTQAEKHMDAGDFLKSLRGARADLLILDPPYSPRQISECYKGMGKTVGMKDTQSGFYQRIRDAALLVLAPGAIVLSFGWNSTGMGRERGFIVQEILLVCHGAGHNDTICLAERMVGQATFFGRHFGRNSLNSK